MRKLVLYFFGVSLFASSSIALGGQCEDSYQKCMNKNSYKLEANCFRRNCHGDSEVRRCKSATNWEKEAKCFRGILRSNVQENEVSRREVVRAEISSNKSNIESACDKYISSPDYKKKCKKKASNVGVVEQCGLSFTDDKDKLSCIGGTSDIKIVLACLNGMSFRKNKLLCIQMAGTVRRINECSKYHFDKDRLNCILK